jgi:hypothetical protein
MLATIIMKYNGNSEAVGTTHGERISSVYETKNLEAIMVRFEQAVTWGGQ